MVKNLPAMQEIQVQSLGWEDPLEKGMATHSSVLDWRIPWTEEPGITYQLDALKRRRPTCREKKKKQYFLLGQFQATNTVELAYKISE